MDDKWTNFSTKHAIKAFPNSLQNDVLSLFDKISLPNNDYHSKAILIIFQGESLEIPSRIYFDLKHNQDLAKTESLILNCLLARHSDGFVRQKSLQRIISSNEIWVTPFIFQLLGEYVIEILEVIKNNLNQDILDNFAGLIKDNPLYFEKTKYRIMSYWSCYYRGRFPKKESYVGFQILEAIKNNSP